MNLTPVQTSGVLTVTGFLSGTIPGLAPVTANNLLVILIGTLDEIPSTFAVSDNRGNSWQLAVTAVGSNDGVAYIGYVPAAIGGSTTISVSSSHERSFQAVVLEFNDSLAGAWELHAQSSLVEGSILTHNCSANGTLIDTNAPAIIVAASVNDTIGTTGFGTVTLSSGYTRIAGTDDSLVWQWKGFSLPVNNERATWSGTVAREAVNAIAAFRVRPHATGCWWPCCYTNTYFTHRQYVNNSLMPQVWQANRGGNSANFITEIAGKVYTAGDLYAGHGVERWSLTGDLEQNFSDDGFRSQVYPMSDGTIIANGYSPTPPYYTAWKYNSDGTVAVALTDQLFYLFGRDSSDNIYGKADFFWKKYDSSGMLQFQKQITTGIGQLSFPYGVDPANGGFTVDLLGNVFAIYYVQGIDRTYYVRKWNSAGTQLWEKSFLQSLYGDMYGLFADSAGGVFVSSSGTSRHLDSAGNTLRTYGAVESFAQDEAGNHYTLHYSGGPPSTVLANVAKFNAADILQWAQVLQWGNVFGPIPRWIAATTAHLYISGSRTVDV